MNYSPAPARWQPLFDASAAAALRAAVAEIAAALTPWRPVAFEPGMDWRLAPARQASLAGGAAGIALFFGYLQACERWLGDEARAARTAADGSSRVLLEYALEILASAPVPAGFYGGFTGVAWAVHHLSTMDPSLFQGEDPLAEADEALLSMLQRPAWREEYDLTGGLVGHGAYALERSPGVRAVRCLERVIVHLEQMAIWSEQGCAWLTPPERLSAQQRLLAPDGWYNLGLAHGVPGVIAVLAAAAAAGVLPERATVLLEGATRWLRTHQLPAAQASVYPAGTSPLGDSSPRSSRLAWCYGDLSIATALDVAARCSGRADWAQEALTLALHAATMSAVDAQVVDTGLCHGAAGVAHLFNRMWQSSGDERLASAARLWFTRTLAMRRPGQGVAGFLSYQPEAGAPTTWYPDAGLLVGAAGIGLAFLAASSPLAPAWDRFLLASAPAAAVATPAPVTRLVD